MRDFSDPPRPSSANSTRRAATWWRAVRRPARRGVPGAVPTAEAIKYADNAFHGLKIGFANELGAVCQALGVDSHQVMDVFLATASMNISPAYLRPGFAFGGSCLPKDLRSLVYAATAGRLSVPILAHVLPSNEEHLQRAIDWSSAPGDARWACSGCRSTPGTDDLRESPLVELAERLFRQGVRPAHPRRQREPVPAARREREYIETRLPHLAQLLADSVDEVLEHAEVVLVGQGPGSAVGPAARRRRPRDRRPRPPPRRRGAPGRTRVRGLAW
ncbi:hypothetical protein GCM10023238_06310 [Streptomyces heliomycini]